jgi:hypothetical protein
MSQYECWWCGRTYYSENNRTVFCSQKCLSEGGGLREARASIEAKNEREEKEREERERLRNLPEEVARRKVESKKYKNKFAWENAWWDAGRNFLLTVLLAGVMTTMFMRTIFPSLFPSLASWAFPAGTRTLFPTTIPEWIVTVIFYVTPIPIGWAAWLFFPLAGGLSQLLLTVIVYSYRKLFNLK